MYVVKRAYRDGSYNYLSEKLGLTCSQKHATRHATKSLAVKAKRAAEDSSLYEGAQDFIVRLIPRPVSEQWSDASGDVIRVERSEHFVTFAVYHNGERVFPSVVLPRDVESGIAAFLTSEVA